jgi:hypothetical protein
LRFRLSDEQGLAGANVGLDHARELVDEGQRLVAQQACAFDLLSMFNKASRRAGTVITADSEICRRTTLPPPCKVVLLSAAAPPDR